MNCLLCGFIERWVETITRSLLLVFSDLSFLEKWLYKILIFLMMQTNVLVSNVFILQDRTNNLFKQVYEQKSLKGRANDAIASACLYIACRQEGVPRTFKGQKEPFYFLWLWHIIQGKTAVDKWLMEQKQNSHVNTEISARVLKEWERCIRYQHTPSVLTE